MFWHNYFMDRDFSRLCTQDGYHHRGHSKTKLLVHLVFVTKYRKLILTGSFGIDVNRYSLSHQNAIIGIFRLWRRIKTIYISCSNILRETVSGISSAF